MCSALEFVFAHSTLSPLQADLADESLEYCPTSPEPPFDMPTEFEVVAPESPLDMLPVPVPMPVPVVALAAAAAFDPLGAILVPVEVVVVWADASIGATANDAARTREARRMNILRGRWRRGLRERNVS